MQTPTLRYVLYRAVADLSLVNGVMDRAARCHSRWLDHDGAAEAGQELTISYTAPLPGCTAVRQRGQIGKGDWLPAFERQLTGLRPGDEELIEFRFPLRFHEPDLAGRQVLFRTFVHAVRARVYYRSIDELAVDHPRILPRIEQVRERARWALEKEATMTAEWLLERQILEDVERTAMDVSRQNRRNVAVRRLARLFDIKFDAAVYERALPRAAAKRTMEVRRAARHIALETALVRHLIAEARERGAIAEVRVPQIEQRHMVEQIAARDCVPPPLIEPIELRDVMAA